MEPAEFLEHEVPHSPLGKRVSLEIKRKRAARARFIGLVVQRREVRVRQRLLHRDAFRRVKLTHLVDQINRRRQGFWV